MTTHIEPWPAGTPCWVDLMASDLGRTQAFYRDVLGWTYTDSQPEYGGYCNALLGDRAVAGLSPTMEGMADAPHAWSVYLATEDIAVHAARAAAAGATPLFEPMQVASFGSMGMWTDPTGASFGMWQADEHTGFEASAESGAVAWCDLMTGDPAGAQDFYAKVFDYTYQDMGDETMAYALFTVPGGQMPAGGIGGPDPRAGDTQLGWSVAFQVEDADAAVRRVREAGGSVDQEPFDFEFGRMASVAGPDREVFAVMTPKEEM
ncbi:VOC family protein [Kocuria sp. CH-021]|uniref:VOC family protein n=1 Tax=Kocuria sp. CH-021 TaxID=3406735 RepID=UPI003C721C96